MTIPNNHGSTESQASILDRKDLQEIQADLTSLRQTCARQQVQLQEMQAQLLEVLNSTWWRIGEPFRMAGRRFPRIARTIRWVAWSAGKCIYYSKKGILRERLTDYYKRKIFLLNAKQKNLIKALGLPEKENNNKNPSDIKIRSSSQPVVSVIIPAYGHVDFTLRCLASIAAAPPKVSIEVFVVEDASGDKDIDLYKKVSGIHLIDRKENLGFLRSCNDAVKHTAGEFVFLLNNDTEVMPGAIDALVQLFHARPDAGLVGARLLYPDGRQQEAGSIIWKDGQGWNYGRLDDPRRPQYNYVREVDYISGAAIMLPRKLWDKLGGFDEHYLPAYCEDSDLAFRVRQAGLKVLYQPKSWIIHHEGISHGTDIMSGVKACQVRNGLKFYARWKDVLLKENYEHSAQIMRARDRAFNRKIILIIDHYVPEPDRDAGSRTIMTFIETFLAMGRIVKLWPANGHESPVYTEALQRMGVEVLYGPWETNFEAWVKKNGHEIDEVLLSRPMIAPMFLPALRKYTKAPVVFYGHDLHFMRMEKEAETIKDSTKFNAAQEMKELERRVWLSVDHVLYPSHEELMAIAKIEPTVNASFISPYAFSSVTPRTTPPPDAQNIMFVAGFRHSPNIDAATWFCSEVLPKVLAVYPNTRLTLAGSNPSKPVMALACDRIEVTGYITDAELERRYAATRVIVAPMRFGAGVKMKVVEALRHGVPLVTTTIGVQGLDNLKSIIDVHDDAESYAAAIIKLMEDDALWAERSMEQTKYVMKYFSAACVREGLEAVFKIVSNLPYEAVA